VFTPPGGRKPALIVLLGALVFAPAGTTAPKRHDAFPLHAGSAGQHVADLQWLLGGKPYAFTQVKPTFKGRPNGSYGASRSTRARDEVPHRLPEARPVRREDDAAARHDDPLLLLDPRGQGAAAALLGRARSERVKGAVRTGATATALAIQQLEVSQLGVHEIPDGSNRGPCISFTCTLGGHAYGPYQGSTGAFGAAWCASFAQWALGSASPATACRRRSPRTCRRSPRGRSSTTTSRRSRRSARS
jgi:hypothetical protein